MTDRDDLAVGTELAPWEESFLEHDEQAKIEVEAGMERLGQLRRDEDTVAELRLSKRTDANQ